MDFQYALFINAIYCFSGVLYNTGGRGAFFLVRYNLPIYSPVLFLSSLLPRKKVCRNAEWKVWWKSKLWDPENYRRAIGLAGRRYILFFSRICILFNLAVQKKIFFYPKTQCSPLIISRSYREEREETLVIMSNENSPIFSIESRKKKNF